MNPSLTTRLRPRDRSTRQSPTPSPVSSPRLDRRSGSLPVSAIGVTRTSIPGTTVISQNILPGSTSSNETNLVEKINTVAQSNIQEVCKFC